MRARDAFEICHEICVAARELVDGRVPTTQLGSASKFLWRPDLRPRLVDYVADFALAGERALASPDGSVSPRRPSMSRRHHTKCPGNKKTSLPGVLRASRLILFRMYYLGGTEYHAARRTLGISERTWADWTDEIRDRVGRECLRAKMFPPGRYFREMTQRSETCLARRNGEGYIADSPAEGA